MLPAVAHKKGNALNVRERRPRSSRLRFQTANAQSLSLLLSLAPLSAELMKY